jgi:hypothetical protein
MRGRLRLPFFYGWLLVAIGFATMAVGVNARTAFSLLYPPILDEFGWDRAGHRWDFLVRLSRFGPGDAFCRPGDGPA